MPIEPLSPYTTLAENSLRTTAIGNENLHRISIFNIVTYNIKGSNASDINAYVINYIIILQSYLKDTCNNGLKMVMYFNNHLKYLISNTIIEILYQYL